LTSFGSLFFSGFGSVRFFQFQAYKTKTEPIGFFKILIGFFLRFGFFGYFFSSFLGLIGFFSPLAETLFLKRVHLIN
jgi:hypothetical protein